MKMDEVAGSGDNEFYTPLYAVKPIFKYVKEHSTIWCPFDTADSWFVKYGEKLGHKMIHSHIDEGNDFFFTFKEADYIISNPPYSDKSKIFYELFRRDIPFAMLVGVVGLFESQDRFNMFKNNEFEMMYFNKRIAYFKDYAEQKPSLSPPFSSVYLTHKMLPKQIIFETVDKEEIEIKQVAAKRLF